MKNNDLFSEFEASFEEPKKETTKTVHLSELDIQPKGLDETGWAIAIPAGTASQKTANYDKMPEGLKEAQERNGVRDHSMGRVTKGNFKWTEDGKVIFEEDPNGAFAVIDPNEVTPPIKELLDRKFPGGTYYGVGYDPVYKAEKTVDAINIIVDNAASIQGFDIEMPNEVQLPQDSTQHGQITIAGTNTPVVADKPKFGRNRFQRAPKEEGEQTKNKINAVKIEEHGIVFDSKIENFLFNLLTQEGIRFEFQKEYILQEGCVYMHERINPIKLIMDFVLLDYPVIVDTKGMMMDHTKLKHKMLKAKLAAEGKEMRIVLPSSQKKCRELIDMLKNGFKLEEPLTEHAATARKNKLKKLKFEWIEGYWVKGESKYLAAWIMQLPNFEFQELLLKHSPKAVSEIDPSQTFLINSALISFEKGYDLERMKYSDFMNGQEHLIDDVWEYRVELEEIGRIAFMEKYKAHNLYYA